jgi:hypothetical protein
VLAGFVADHMTVLDQPTLLQRRKGAGHDFLPPVIVQNLLAQATWMGMQQAGQDFFFQVFIDVHGDLLVGMDECCSSLALASPYSILVRPRPGLVPDERRAVWLWLLSRRRFLP